MNDKPVLFDSPKQLAELLFAQLVLGDEPKIIPHEDELRASPDFYGLKFERERFRYLVAVIAVAITDAINKGGPKPLAEVIPYLRDLVREEMNERWEEDEESADYAITSAAQDYSRLVLVDADKHHALWRTWTQDWLKSCGIECFNPVTLFLISQSWIEQYIAVAKILARVQFRE